MMENNGDYLLDSRRISHYPALHLLHHRLAKRHISFAEVVSAVVLCVPPRAPLPAWLLVGAHLSLIAVQVVGSLWIRKLSPNWPR